MSIKSTILVTGGCGFIGSHFVKKAIEVGHKVVVIDDLSTGKLSRLDEITPVIEGNFADKNILSKVFSQHHPDTLVHLAASLDVAESVENPEKYYQNNVVNSTILWEFAAKHGIKKIIFSSSCAVYGNKSNPAKEGDVLAPQSPYGETKIEGEFELIRIGLDHGIPTGIMRLFNVGGAINQLASACYQIIERRKDKITVYGKNYHTKDGTCLRDYVHVNDVVKGLINAISILESRKKSFIVNIGSGHAYSVIEIINIIENLSGHKIPYTVSPRRAGDATSIVADMTHFQEIYGWLPKDNAQEIFRYGYEWYKNDQDNQSND